ncbi:MAG: Plug domain-containing protein [Bacteroidales bacterium]|jgi:hypothetical protein|nr:Plug domain-containing protein [Bacteroidales bacterium]
MKSLVSLILFLISVHCYCQGSELKIVVKDKKDMPVRSVVVETMPSGKEYKTDKSGMCILSNLNDIDSVLVTFPGSSVKGAFPADLFTELQFNTSRSVLEAFDPVSGTMIAGREKRVVKKGEFDIAYEITAGAKNLEDLLKRMPQLMVTGGQISLRNPVQTAQFSNTSPLIVVDGFPVQGGLAEANRIVNIHTIESIEVLRDGTLYGRDALNGAIIVKLKK